MHWCLAIIDFERKEIRYYDSMGGNNQKCLNALRSYLEEEHKGLLTDWVILYDEWINHSHYLNLNIWETQRGTYWLSTTHITPFYTHCLLRCIHVSQKKKQLFLLYPFLTHPRFLPRQEKEFVRFWRLELRVRQRHSSANEWVRLRHVHLQIRRIRHTKGRYQFYPRTHALLPKEDDLWNLDLATYVDGKFPGRVLLLHSPLLFLSFRIYEVFTFFIFMPQNSFIDSKMVKQIKCYRLRLSLFAIVHYI